MGCNGLGFRVRGSEVMLLGLGVLGVQQLERGGENIPEQALGFINLGFRVQGFAKPTLA